MSSLPLYLRRKRLAAWGTLMTRSLAAAGLLLTAALAASAQRGLISLAFLTAAALVGIAVQRALEASRRAGAALRLHRTLEGAMSGLAARGWHLKHNVPWPEGSGIGHLAMIPTGDLAFAIKDCNPAIDDFDLGQTQELSTALSRTGRPYIPICVAAAGDPSSSAERGVICCTPEQLTIELLDAERGFMASLLNEAAQHELLYSESTAG